MDFLKLPDPIRVEIELWGSKVFIEERTAEQRYFIEDVLAHQNGDTGLDFILTIQAIAFALECNIKPWRPFRNRKFKRRYLKRHLKASQIEFLFDQLNRLELGDEYDEFKKKVETATADRAKKLIEGLSGDSFPLSSE